MSRHVHIHSEDFASGTPSNATFNLSAGISGTFKLEFHQFDEQAIPWIYTGCNTLILEDAALNQETLIFPQTNLFDSASVIIMFDIAFATTTNFSGTVTTYDAATDVYTFTTDAGDTLNGVVRFSDTNTTFDKLYPKTSAPVDFINAVPGTSFFTLPGNYVDGRPPMLDLIIGQAIVKGISSRSASTFTLMIPMATEVQMSGAFTISKSVNAISLKWERVNAPGFVCPFVNLYDLVFS